MTRRGFTLIELLIVVSVIGLLSAILLPAVGLVRAAANKAKCANNMRNIAIAIIAYRNENSDTFPGRFTELLTSYSLPPKILLCPVDTSKGLNPNMGRGTDPGSWGDYSRLWYLQTSNTSPGPTQVTACSYDYECSGWIDPSGTLLTGFPTQYSDIDYFYRDMPAGERPAAGTVSWALAKLHQTQFGNILTGSGDSATFGTPFPPGNVPMIRCYDHFNWGSLTPQALQSINKVINISIEGNLIFSSPFWEHDVNPNISIPAN